MSQVAKGKAFEYVLAKAISSLTDASIVSNKSYQKAKSYFLDVGNNSHLELAANEAAIFLQCHDERFALSNIIRLQDDFRGRGGDVRDIIVGINGNEIGISAKHNHQAVKHSRLSDKIDFGKEWAGYPVSNYYWKRVKPIFQDMRKRGAAGQFFRDLESREGLFYLPILTAFEDELRRLCEDFGRRFILKFFQYLVGNQGFYKVVCQKKNVNVSSVNIDGTLEWGKKWVIPSRIEQIKRKEQSNNTLLVTFQGGWQLSFRLHNTRSRIEPSLKFDIQFIGMPQNVARHEIPLKDAV